MTRKIFTIVAAFSFTLVFGQSGPAGIGSSLSNNFWVDANKLNVVDGAQVSVLPDVSGNGNDFSQFSSTAQPIYSLGAINGLPSLVFDGVSDCLLSNSMSGLETNELTWFVVYKKAPLNSQCIIGGNYDSNNKLWESYCNGSNNKMVNSHYSSGSIKHNIFIDNGSSFNFLANVITPSSLKTYKNGLIQGTRSATYVAPSGHNFVTLGRYPSSSSYFLEGQIAEAFVFNVALNNLERILVENYLGAKYGFAIPTDLYSFQGSHNMGVIGLGNDGSDSHTDSQGAGAVRISAPTAMSSGEYLLVGHTNVDLLTYETADLPPAVSSHTRWLRTWRVDETGDVGDVTMVFDMSGVNAFGVPLTYNLLVDSDDGDFSNAAIVSGVYDAASQTMTFVTDLNSGDFFTISGEFLPPTAIHSITSGSWSEEGTWDCTCVPTITDTVYIQNSDIVNVDVDAFTHELHVEGSATLNMSDDVQLSILGDMTVAGNIGFTNGTLGLVGASDQTLSAEGGSIGLNEVLIENTGTSNINFTNGEFLLNNTLHPNNGVMNINSGGTFVINSTSSTTTGKIGQIQGSFSTVGNVTVRRFIAAGNAGERTLSSPVVGADLSMWDADVSISGTGFPDGCAGSSEGCYFSCKRFSGGDFGTDYIDVTNPNEPLNSGVGYELFLGDNLTSFSGATLSSTGTLRDGSDFDYTSSLATGWNLIGNPYASPIEFPLITKNRVGDYYYIYDVASGSYQWYDGGSGTSSIADLSGGKIAMGQGFWLYANFFPVLTYSQTSKSDNSATFVRNSNVDESIYLTLTQEGTTYKNTISISFDEGAYDDVDSLDVLAFTVAEQASSSLFIKTSENLLAKNYLRRDGMNKVLSVKTKILNSGFFKIDARGIESVNEYSNVLLIDEITGDVVNLKEETGYTFYAEEGELERFTLVFSNTILTDFFPNEINNDSKHDGLEIIQMGSSVSISSTEDVEGISLIEVRNLLGQKVVYSESLNIVTGINIVMVPPSLSGVYLLVVKNVNGIETKKIIL